tara:strand:- start:2274 stop:3503 length:1230 start_codon:yes stop_codon:yes gene_type:complete
MFNAEQDIKKWAPVLEHADAAPITDSYKKAVTAKLLENTEVALKAERAQYGNLNENNQTTGAVSNFDPVLISLVRRAMPNLIAYDVAGVQPMSGPTGLIFAMKARYNDTAPSTVTTADTEALGLDEPNTAFSGPATTAAGEALGVSGGTAFGDMGFTIEKAVVEAKTRGLKAEYTMELAQDLKAIHNLDAESELANILSTEILAEINREVINTINAKAIVGFNGSTTPGTTDTFNLSVDADGRWAVEKFKSLMFQIEVEANKIALETRRGKGNFIICSSNVASALAAAGVLDYAPALATNLQVDATGNTFAGVLNGRMKVYVDPYAGPDYVTVGYRGTNAYDAGLFYCPYVPLTMVRAVDESTFQPKVAFKTRYGMQQNPFVGTATGVGTDASNAYFRKFLVTNINVAG